MSFIDKLREGIFKVRVIPKPDPASSASFTSEKDTINKKLEDAIESGKRIDLSELLTITTLKGDRDTKYSIFEEMVSDGRIGAAVEMYANDTVQYNQDGKIIWVESEDSDVAKYANKLLDDLNIADNIWSYAYCLWLYGDVYLELFQSASNDDTRPGLLLEPVQHNTSVRKQVDIAGAKLERYIEKVPNPAEIYDLQYKGKTSGFIRSKDTKNTHENNTYLYQNETNIDVMNPTKFIHICLSPNINRFPEKFRLIKDDIEKVNEDGYIDGSSSEGSTNSLTFSVKTGQSILENVYGAYQILKLKEDSVLLERVTKSSITRVIQVELGDLPESQKRAKLQEIKQQIEQQIQLNKETGNIQSRSGAQPNENIIYTATRNGKGTISTVNIGGDVDIGNLSDLDQSENKVYGSLLIPKALLGADMEGSGLSNGGSLTEMNTTYARRIKRGQVAICSGIKNLINIFAISDGLSNKVIGNFEVKLTPIVTVEDNRRDELMQNKIRNVNDILSLFNNLDIVDETTKLDMIIKWLGSYLNQQDIVDIINERLKELDDTEDSEEDKPDSADDAKFNMSSGNSTPSNINNINIADTENENDEVIDNADTNIETPEPELNISNDIDLSSIEGQDLL